MTVNGYGPDDFAIGEEVRFHLKYSGGSTVFRIRRGIVLNTNHPGHDDYGKIPALRLNLKEIGVFVRNKARMSPSRRTEQTYLYENISRVYKFNGKKWIEYKAK